MAFNSFLLTSNRLEATWQSWACLHVPAPLDSLCASTTSSSALKRHWQVLASFDSERRRKHFGARRSQGAKDPSASSFGR